MKIVIPGGSGQVGVLLGRAFHGEGHEVVVLSRAAMGRPATGRRAMPWPWHVVGWDGVTLDGAWAGEIDGCDVVINLAGRSVNCRYTPANRRDILESRVQSTRVVGQAIRLPATRWMLELGAMFLRTETELVLKSRRVTPRRLLEDGFVFTHAQWADAARDLCQRWRQAR